MDHSSRSYRFEVRGGIPKDSIAVSRGTRAQKKATFLCLLSKPSNVPITAEYIREEGKNGRIRTRLMAIVATTGRGRIYLAPQPEHEESAAAAKPSWGPEGELADNPRYMAPPLYGMKRHRDLFTPRQLEALTAFSDLVAEAREGVLTDARAAGMPDDGKPLSAGGTSATAYADSVVTYLAFAIDKCADYWNTIATWAHSGGFIRNCFARQAIPMTWDFAEGNAFSNSTANWMAAVEWVSLTVHRAPCGIEGECKQLDAVAAVDGAGLPVIVTDPPYYDNIGYADLSDFFYVWLRRSIGKLYPDLFSTLLTPKAEELIASPYRFDGSREKADEFFEEGLGRALERLRKAQHPAYPLTLFYAFKQAESEEADEGGSGDVARASTGWETMLEGLIKAGFVISGSWPMRTERGARSISIGTNALASSIVLVCQPRPEDAPLATRREYLSALKNELPAALRKLQQGNIAPVDLAQAAIGPGMAVFSRYAKIVEADGSPMTVRTALGIINQTLDEILAEQESEFDGDTRWALAWFDQFGVNEGPFGVAETLSKAKNTAVNGLVEAGILTSKGGKVRLLKREELATDWSPTTDRRLTVWEVAQYLIRALQEQGETGAAALLRKVGFLGETARDLAYRLYSTCDRKGWTQEAMGYNSLVVAWPEITRLARAEQPAEQQARLNL